MSATIRCPPLSLKKFQTALRVIELGAADNPQQTSVVVRPADCTADELGIIYAFGELQKFDLSRAITVLAYPRFVLRTFANNRPLFDHSEGRIYQFQMPQTRGTFVFGLFITDFQNVLIDFCLETTQAAKRRQVLLPLMRAVCTSESVSRRAVS
jgi:hypothetical protein